MINNSNESVLMDDANSPDLNRKLMGFISEDFVKVTDHLKEASYQIRKRGFSEHPIFVVTNQEVELGIMLLASGEMNNDYHYRASYMQEFVDRKLIGPESVLLFTENYKNPDEFCCLFALIGDFSGFIFVPYPED